MRFSFQEGAPRHGGGRRGSLVLSLVVGSFFALANLAAAQPSAPPSVSSSASSSEDRLRRQEQEATALREEVAKLSTAGQADAALRERLAEVERRLEVLAGEI